MEAKIGVEPGFRRFSARKLRRGRFSLELHRNPRSQEHVPSLSVHSKPFLRASHRVSFRLSRPSFHSTAEWEPPKGLRIRTVLALRVPRRSWPPPKAALGCASSCRSVKNPYLTSEPAATPSKQYSRVTFRPRLSIKCLILLLLMR